MSRFPNLAWALRLAASVLAAGLLAAAVDLCLPDVGHTQPARPAAVTTAAP